MPLQESAQYKGLFTILTAKSCYIFDDPSDDAEPLDDS